MGTTAQIFLANLHIFSMFAVDARRIKILLAVGCLCDEELSRSMASLKVLANRKFNLKRGDLIMEAIRLFLISFFVLCVSTTDAVASNESSAAKIQRAMKAAPSSISAGATIRDVDADWTILRHGEPGNTWTCFPGVPVNPGDKHPMCNDEVWMDWLWAVKALLEGGPWTFTTETVGTSYMLRGDAFVSNDSPVATDPYNGDMWDQEGPHIMMLFPTRAEIAHLPRDPNAGGPYVMWDQWPLVHVMIPMTDRDR